jgi:hypothetical protein
MTLLPLLLVLASTPPPDHLPRSGYFGAGVNLEPLAMGPMQAISGGGAAVGLTIQGAIQVDVGPRWALRLPLELGAGGSGDSTFAELALTPGVLYRWRDDADQRWVPYFGGGFKLGLAGANRGLLGLPLVTSEALDTQALDIHFHHHDGDSSSDPNDVSRLGAFPELWAGLEWHPTRWFALNLGGAYTYVRLAGTNVHLLHERVGLRFSL